MPKTLNCNGRIISLDLPVVMGIININDDSFFAPSRAQDLDTVVKQAEKMISEGATILDIGAMSSRPGAKLMHDKMEWSILKPVVEKIVHTFPEVTVSIDTLHSSVAAACIDAGAGMINDISAGSYDMKMMETVALKGVPYVMMHMQGMPATMQDNPQYDEVVMDVMKFFVQKIKQAAESGINDIIIDPGFGFGKTLDHNYMLMSKLDVFNLLDFPLMVGVSRKSMICKTLHCSPENALNGSTALHMFALLQGTSILRVHDVKEAAECISIFNRLKAAMN